MAKSVSIKIGFFEGRTNLSAVQMDDFKFILGLEFFRDIKIAVLSYSDFLIMMGRKLFVIFTQVGKIGEKCISVMQFSKGFRRNEFFFLCVFRLEEIDEVTGFILKFIIRFKEVEDILSEELLKKLSRVIVYEIEFVPGVKFSVRVLYRMVQSEFEEVRKSAGEVLRSGIFVEYISVLF